MTSKRYPLEFKLAAVRSVTAGGERAQDVARRLGVAPGSLYRWIKCYAEAGDGMRAVSETEHRRLERAPALERQRGDRARRSEHLLRIAARSARVGGWSIELDGHHLFWSEEVRVLLGFAPGETPSWEAMLALCLPTSQAAWARAVEACARQGLAFDCKLDIRAAQGELLCIRVLGRAVQEPSGSITRIEGSFQDITDPHQAELALQRHMARLEAAEAHARLGSWELFANGEAWWSREMYELMGLDPQAGQPTLEAYYEHIHPDDRADVRRMQETMLRGITPAFVVHRTNPLHGPVRHLAPTMHCERDSAGRVIKFSGTVLDITERAHAEEALRRSERLLKIAGRAARIGGWMVDLRDRHMVWTDEVCAIHGMSPGVRVALEEGINFYAPEWRERIRAVFAACVEAGTPYDEVLQIIDTHGRRVWVRAIGEAVRDASGAIVQVQGALQDITERMEAEQAALRAAERLTTTLESITDAFYTVDREWRFTYLNREASRVLQRDRTELIGRDVWDEFPEARGGMLEHEFRRAMAEGKTVGFEAHFSFLNAWLEVRAYPSDEGLAVHFRDVSERKRIQDALRQSEERFAHVAKATTDAVWDWDIRADTLWWSEGIKTLFGYLSDEVGPALEGWVQRIHPGDRDRVVGDITRAVEEVAQEWSAEYRFRRKDGSYAEVVDYGFILRDERGAAARMVGGMSDITERKRADQEIQRLAFYDPLTRLPNRRLLLDRLQHALDVSARSGAFGGLIVIDLDNFKALNDTLGHQKGDLLLQEVAARLPACVRESDTVSRFGGDEFVVMVEQLGKDMKGAGVQLKAVAEKILAALDQSYRVAGHEHHSTASLGLTLMHGHELTPDALLQRADVALYQAKAAGRNTLRFFDPVMQAAVSARARLEAELRLALQRDEFRLHYQPQVDGAGRVLAAEALLRWQHPTRGLVLPDQFIPLAEETGLILPLGTWVLETACAQLVAWAARPETARLGLAVNISARQFHHADFVTRLREVIVRTGADPWRLKLELTETSLIQNMEDTVSKMSNLREDGIGFSLDDFGTGYSSLYYLKRLPLDELKIDRCFVRDVLDDPNDAAIVRAVLVLAQSLGLAVIAEGVESQAQQACLVRHGCLIFQGFLFSVALPAEQFQAFIARDAPRASAGSIDALPRV